MEKVDTKEALKNMKFGVEEQKEYIKYLIKHLKEGNKEYHDEILIQLLGTIDQELGNEYFKTLRSLRNE